MNKIVPLVGLKGKHANKNIESSESMTSQIPMGSVPTIDMLWKELLSEIDLETHNRDPEVWEPIFHQLFLASASLILNTVHTMGAHVAHSGCPLPLELFRAQVKVLCAEVKVSHYEFVAQRQKARGSRWWRRWFGSPR